MIQKQASLKVYKLKSKDDKKDEKKCEQCLTKFGFLSAKHTCKRCLKIICEKCGTTKRFIVNGKISKKNEEHKVCINCGKDSLSQEQLRLKFQTKWAEDCLICLDWMKALKIKYDNLDEEIFKFTEQLQSVSQHSLSSEKKGSSEEKQLQNLTKSNQNILSPTFNQDIQFKQALILSEEAQESNAYKTFQELLKNSEFIDKYMQQNYSFKEMFYYQTDKKYDKPQLLKIVTDVILAFINIHYKDIGFSEDTLYLACFLLNFACPSKVWLLLQEIYKKIIPNYLYPVNIKTIGVSIMNKQIQQFQDLLKSKYGVAAEYDRSIQEYLELKGTKCLSCMFLDKLNFDCCFAIIDDVIRAENKYQKLVQGLLSVVSIHRELIQSSENEYLDIDQLILDNSQKTILLDAMKIQIQLQNSYQEETSSQALLANIKQLHELNQNLKEENLKLKKNLQIAMQNQQIQQNALQTQSSIQSLPNLASNQTSIQGFMNNGQTQQPNNENPASSLDINALTVHAINISPILATSQNQVLIQSPGIQAQVANSLESQSKQLSRKDSPINLKDPNEDINNLRKELQQKQQQIQDLESKILLQKSNKDNQISLMLKDHNTFREDLEKKINSQQFQINDLQKQLSYAQAEILQLATPKQKHDSANDRQSIEDNASLFKSVYNSNSIEKEELVKILQSQNKQKEIEIQQKQVLLNQTESQLQNEKKQTENLNSIINQMTQESQTNFLLNTEKDKQIQVIQSKYESLEKDNANLKNQISNLKQQIQNINNLSSSQISDLKIQHQKQQLEQGSINEKYKTVLKRNFLIMFKFLQYTKANKDKSELMQEIELFKKKIKKLNQEKEDLKIQLQLNDDNVDEIKKERDQVQKKLSSIGDDQSKQQSDNLQKIDEQQSLIQKLKLQIQELEAQQSK